MVISNELPVCKGRWTWECGDKKSVIDYMLFPQEHRHELVEMIVEDKGVYRYRVRSQCCLGCV